jgi:Flp pilus assembly protein TadB
MNATHRPHFAVAAITVGCAAGALALVALLTLDALVALAGLILALAAFVTYRIHQDLRHLTPAQEESRALREYAAVDRADRDF